MNQGIVRVSEELKIGFGSAVGDDVRALIVKIDFDTLEFVLDGKIERRDDLAHDFHAVAAQLDPASPTIVLMYLDPKWMLLSCVPESSIVRQKMVYASAKNELKTCLGTPKFISDYFITEPSECSLASYTASIDTSDRDLTLTQSEVLTAEEVKDSFPRAVKSNAMKMLDVPAEESAVKALLALQEGVGRSALFGIDMDNEKLTAMEPVEGGFSDMVDKVDAECPCYIVFHWKHKDNHGKDVMCNLFIFYCPDDAHPRMKMTYSTVKKNVLSACEALGVAIQHKFEFSEMNEFDEDQVLNTLYPQRVEKKLFSRPKGPGTRKGHRV